MIQFKLVTETGERILHGATTLEQARKVLHESGMVNMGRVCVHKLEYQLVRTTPQIIDTDYGR